MAREKYPTMKGRNPTHRLPTTPYPTLNRMIDTGNMYEIGYENLRNYAAVILPYCSGLRPVEMQNARVENISPDFTTIYVDVVKGQDKYGEPRHTPIHESGRRIIERYVKTRNALFGPTGYLFTVNGRDKLSTNTLRRFKKAVETEINHNFDFREARRTYGQMLIDEGNDIEDVSRVMGHRTSKTTETYYARRTQGSAVANILNRWKKQGENQ